MVTCHAENNDTNFDVTSTAPEQTSVSKPNQASALVTTFKCLSALIALVISKHFLK